MSLFLLQFDTCSLYILTVNRLLFLDMKGADRLKIFENLPTSTPTVSGSLWMSGSAGQGSQFLVVWNGK